MALGSERPKKNAISTRNRKNHCIWCTPFILPLSFPPSVNQLFKSFASIKAVTMNYFF